MAGFSLFPTSSTLVKELALDPDERGRLTGFLRRIVQTPSPPGQEGDVAALVRQELRDGGVEDVQVDRAGSIIVTLGDGDGPTLLYDAHLDTVVATDAPWPHAPFDGAIVDGVLYGLGACDMKGPLAAMVYAARQLARNETPLHGRLVLAFVVQEEPCEGCALKVLVEGEGLRPDWVLLGEPSNLRVMRGHRGRVMFRVTVHGKSSHASSPELGQNAITAAARLIFGIDLLAADLATDPFLGPGTIAVTHIESQAPSLNAIPDTCTFYIDRRLTLGETPTRAQAQIEGVIEREGIEADLEVVVFRAESYTGYPLETREAFNAWALDQDHVLLKTTLKAVQQVTGENPIMGHWAFSTDGVYSMGEAQIPTVGYGPGDPQNAHTIHDQVRLADVAQAAHVYAVLAASLLDGS
jgi:putative selenium metabolism hydrolase